jgi:hypothetical protein
VPAPDVSIIAHRIITVDGPLNPAASAAAPDDCDIELEQAALGPIPQR